MATTTTETKTAGFTVTRVVVAAFMVGALALSYVHIVHLFMSWGSGWQAWIAPAFIDGFAILGIVGRGKAFAAATRKRSMWIQIVAMVISFGANVTSGGTGGDRAIGAMVVLGYVVSEMFAHTMRPASDDMAAAKAEMNAQRAAKAAVTRAATKRTAALKAANRAETARIRKANATAAQQ